MLCWRKNALGGWKRGEVAALLPRCPKLGSKLARTSHRKSPSTCASKGSGGSAGGNPPELRHRAMRVLGTAATASMLTMTPAATESRKA